MRKCSIQDGVADGALLLPALVLLGAWDDKWKGQAFFPECCRGDRQPRAPDKAHLGSIGVTSEEACEH